MKVKNSFGIIAMSLLMLTACDQFAHNDAEDLIKARDVALNASDDLEKVAASFDKIITKYKNSKDNKVLALTFETMVGKGDLLTILATQKAKVGSAQTTAIRRRAIATNTAAIAFHDQVLKTREGEKPLSIEENLASAYYGNALGYAALNNKNQSLALYQLIIDEFSDSSNQSVLDTVARALNNKGAMFSYSGRYQEAIDSYSELIKRFKDTPNEELQIIVTTTLYNKGYALQNLNRLEEALSFYEQVIDRTRGVKSNKAQNSLMQALFRKSVILKKQGNKVEAARLKNEGAEIFNNLKNKNYL